MPDDITNSIKQGTYRGRLESTKNNVLKAELRLDRTTNTISADFSFTNTNSQEQNHQDTYYCSMRANLLQRDQTLAVINPQFIFDQQQDPRFAGYIELKVQKEPEIQIACLIPEAIPEKYSGVLSFESEFFRIINIEVDKLEGYPWPPEFSTDVIPEGEQPEDIRAQNLPISIKDIFHRAGIEANVHLDDEAILSTIGQRTNRPGEEEDVRWDERELHEMMETYYSRQQFNLREWWLYLLILSRFDGGIETDATTGQTYNKGDSINGIMFDKVSGNIGSFFNTRARQGAAVFWQTILNNRPDAEQWYKNRLLIHTIIHEIGHILNLPHATENNRPDSISFMGKTSWRAFRYEFDLEELFHIHHGFYNEVIPGGNLAFRQWSSSSVLRASTSNLEQPNLALAIKPSRQVFHFTEPVTIEVSVENRSSEEIVVGNLSPAYGDLHFFIHKPNGVITEYKTPLYKCSAEQESLNSQERKTHFTSLAVNRDHFTFDTPGRYEIIATLPDRSNQTIAIAPPVSVVIEKPNKNEEKMAELIFNRDASLFLYMGGGNHLQTAKTAFLNVVEQFPNHPTATHANLILGLNELAGQKRITQPPDLSNLETATTHFNAALQSNKLPKKCYNRLHQTLKMCHK